MWSNLQYLLTESDKRGHCEGSSPCIQREFVFFITQAFKASNA